MPNFMPPMPFTLPAETDDVDVRLLPQRMLTPGVPSAALPAPATPEDAAFQKAYAEILGQRSSNVDQLKARLADAQANKPNALMAINAKPMMAFADSLNGTHTADSYQMPTAVADNKALQQKLQDEIMKEQNGLSDDQLNYLKMKSLERSRQASTDVRAATAAATKDTRERRLALQDDKFAQSMGKGIDTDKIITGAVEQNQNLQKALHTLQGGMITPQILSEIENDLATALSGKGGATDHVRKNVEMDAYQRTAADLKQRFTGSPQGVNMPEYAKYLSSVIQRLQEANQLNVAARTKQLQSGLGNISSSKARNMVSDKISQMTGSAPPVVDVGAPKVGEVQDGHRFKGGDPSDANNWEAVK